MSRVCEVCEKKGKMVWRLKKLRGKYNPTVKYRQQPNLQSLNVPIDVKRKEFKEFAGKSVLACTRCRRTMVKPLK
ncbi:MAG: hypothetical protein ISS87_01960 [Candidatus Pacebacteria bacterium]|nr:hypothetical protein [Candidatus Paceibacterota bacterium]